MDSKKKWRPPLTTLFIYLTQRCNLLCKHCYIDPTYSTTIGRTENEIDVAILLDFIDEAIPLGLSSIKISGGEPFLRWQDVLCICCHAKDRGINVAIETNGMLINDELADALAQAGVNFISVSLDGATAEAHESIRRVRGSYEKAVCAIETLASHGIDTQIITTITKENIRDYLDILKLGMERGANSIKFNLVAEIGRGESWEDSISLREYLGFYKEVASNRFITCLVNLPMAHRKLGNINLNQRCNILSLLSILADGSISICGMGVHSESLILGTVGLSNLENLFENHPLLRELRMSIPDKLEGVCGMCVFKESCLGYCRALEFLRTQSFTTPYSFCQRAFDFGLFPEGRLLNKKKSL